MTTSGSMKDLVEDLKRDAKLVAGWMFLAGYAVGFLSGACAVLFLS